MKLIAFSLLTTLSLSSYAMGTEKLIKVCQPVGTQKLELEANSYNLKLDSASVKECGVDNRLFNIAAYVWFCGKTTGGEKSLKVLTQKPLARPCF